jgi:octaprenyl-diphosphate synthase
LPLTCIDRWNAPGDLKNRVYALWGEHLRRLHLGQSLDIHWHRNVRSLPREEDYLLMCRLKTGSLARLAALLGGHIAAAGASPPTPEEGVLAALGDGAEKLGVGFQILDDVKNLTTGIPGKSRGDDMVEGKKSLPLLLFLDRCPEALPQVEGCFAAARAGGAAVPEVEALIQAMESQGVLEEALGRGYDLLEEARGVFGSLAAPKAPRPESPQEALRLLSGFPDLIR